MVIDSAYISTAIAIAVAVATAVIGFRNQSESKKKQVEKETAELLFQQLNLLKDKVAGLEGHVKVCEDERKVVMAENLELHRLQTKWLTHLPDSFWHALEGLPQ